MADASRVQFIATRTTKPSLPHSSGHQRAGVELDEFMQMIGPDAYLTRRLQISRYSVLHQMKSSFLFKRQGAAAVCHARLGMEQVYYGTTIRGSYIQ